MLPVFWPIIRAEQTKWSLNGVELATYFILCNEFMLREERSKQATHENSSAKHGIAEGEETA